MGTQENEIKTTKQLYFKVNAQRIFSEQSPHGDHRHLYRVQSDASLITEERVFVVRSKA